MTGINAARLAMLAIFSGLSVNLILQCGFGLQGIALNKNPGKKEMFTGLGIVFVTVLLLWFVFSFVFSVLPLGLAEYLLLFPASSLVFSFFEYAVHRFVLRITVEKQQPVFPGTWLAAAALFIMLNIAGRFSEAMVLLPGFTLGAVLAFVIIGEIRRRSVMEAVPRFLRGGPLTLVAMGLLSLVFSSAALMFYQVLGG